MKYIADSKRSLNTECAREAIGTCLITVVDKLLT